jgi:hypothetical protein
MIHRRHLLAALSVLTLPNWAAAAPADAALLRLKSGYGRRIKKILAAGELPYIDIESSCNSGRVDIALLAKHMDQLNMGPMALSADIGDGQFGKGVRYDYLSKLLTDSFPEHFIPVGNGGQPPGLTDDADAFIDAQAAAALAGNMALLGEYEFRHYPSPRQAKRSTTERDVAVPIDGPTGHRVFSLSESTGLSFQIHYEIEDALLPPLEKMLQQYPKAKVIWCHLAQIRYLERAQTFSPAYVDGLLTRFPNLYFDTAFGDYKSVYPLSGQRHARVWAANGSLKPEWRDLIAAHSRKFMSALDLGGDRLDRIQEYDQRHRYFLSCLPPETQHQVAYKTAWSLLFGEDFG